MSENVVHACDVLLVPLLPAMLSVRTYDQLIDFVDTMSGRKPKVMGFLSMVDRRKKAHREFSERLPNDHASVVPEAGGGAGWRSYFYIPDIDAGIATTTRMGGLLQQGPDPIPGGDYSAIIADPNGAQVGIVGPRIGEAA